jgi:Fe2+ or Zn2+ uptake regulation protein
MKREEYNIMVIKFEDEHTNELIDTQNREVGFKFPRAKITELKNVWGKEEIFEYIRTHYSWVGDVYDAFRFRFSKDHIEKMINELVEEGRVKIENAEIKIVR